MWDIGTRTQGWLEILLLHLQTPLDITSNLKARSPSTIISYHMLFHCCAKSSVQVDVGILNLIYSMLHRVVKFPWKVIISDPFKKPEIIFLCWHADYNWEGGCSGGRCGSGSGSVHFSFQLIININSSASFQHEPSLWPLLWEIIKCGRMHCNE